MSEHTAFFGDGEHVFKLTSALITELERLTGTGIGGASKRLIAGEWRANEVIQIVRLSLIGGGLDPQEAQALIDAYSIPLMPLWGIALSVLERTLTGDQPHAE